MPYELIECVVKEIILGSEVRFSFEPISKYKMMINGETFYIAVDLSNKRVISIPSSKLTNVKLKENDAGKEKKAGKETVAKG